MLNIIKNIILILSLSFSVFIFIEDRKFPVDYIICDSNYTDCFISAKFSNMRDCQIAAEMGDWLCDKSDANNITCRVSNNSIASGYCKD